MRLQQHNGIDVDVRSTAWGLAEGRFGGVTVNGRRWRTPLELTAEAIDVDIGELLIDYGKLVWQQTVALRNVPAGSCSLTLTGRDLANFVVHPITKEVISNAIQGKSFVFDRNTVGLALCPTTGQGIVTYEGVWGGDGNRYAARMYTPSTIMPGAASHKLRVVARLVPPVLRPPPAGGSMASVDTDEVRPMRAVGFAAAAAAGTGSLASVAGSEGSDSELDETPGSRAVSQGLMQFFSALLLNMQGIELSQPSLLMMPNPGNPAAGPLLKIAMVLQIRQLPPLNMQF